MGKVAQRARDGVMYFSMQERRKREVVRFEEELQKLRSMSALELESAYVSAKTRYEHHRTVLSLFLISIVLAVLMNVWKYFFSFVEQLSQMAFDGQADSAEAARVGFAISIVFVVAITLAVFLILIACVRKHRLLYRDLLVIEEVRNDNGRFKESQNGD